MRPQVSVVNTLVQVDTPDIHMRSDDSVSSSESNYNQSEQSRSSDSELETPAKRQKGSRDQSKKKPQLGTPRVICCCNSVCSILPMLIVNKCFAECHENGDRQQSGW